MDIKEVEKIVKKGKKSKFQNCFQCEYFPKLDAPFANFHKTIGMCWRVPDIESLRFRCRYLRKKVGQEIKPFQSNHCLCFELKRG